MFPKAILMKELIFSKSVTLPNRYSYGNLLQDQLPLETPLYGSFCKFTFTNKS